MDRLISSRRHSAPWPTSTPGTATHHAIAGNHTGDCEAGYLCARCIDVTGGKTICRPVIQNGETVYIVQIACSLTERDRTLQFLATTLGVAGLLTILIAFGADWAPSGLSLRPIHRITQTAQEIGDELGFTRRVDYTGPQDEVEQGTTVVMRFLR